MDSKKQLFALTIAGGQGQRLRPLTDALPKPMVPINDEPLLLHQVRALLAGGVTDIVFLCSYMAEVISDFFGDGSQFGFRAHYSLEKTPLGRGGALRQGLDFVPADAKYFIALNGDIITREPLRAMVEFHKKVGAAATVLTVPYPNSFGIVQSDEAHRIQNFGEKIELPYQINGGVYVMNRGIQPLLPEQGDHEDSTFPKLAREGTLYAYQTAHYWRAVDTIKDLKDAEQNV